MTAVEVGRRPGMVRRDGVLTPVPAAWRTRSVDFGQGPTSATTIPWGDVFTAYHTTGIPSIEVFVAMPPAARLALGSTRVWGRLMRSEQVKKVLRTLVRRLPDGPDETALRSGYALLWGEASDDVGDVAVSRVRTPHTSIVTALASLLAVKRVLGGVSAPGFQTPAGLYGPDLALEIPGVTRTDVTGRG